MSSPESLQTATAHLAAQSRAWSQLIHTVGPCTLTVQTGREPYESLTHAVAHQQLHGKAAEAMLRRLSLLFGGQEFPYPEDLLAVEPEQLRACGFSGRKVATLRAIAEGTVTGVVPDRETAAQLSDEDLIARLTALPGIGAWTVQMLLIFTLGRLDVWPVDDFGVREGWRRLAQLPEQPKPRVMRDLGEPLRPWRSVAAWYLWRYPREQDALDP